MIKNAKEDFAHIDTSSICMNYYPDPDENKSVATELEVDWLEGSVDGNGVMTSYRDDAILI